MNRILGGVLEEELERNLEKQEAFKSELSKYSRRGKRYLELKQSIKNLCIEEKRLRKIIKIYNK